MYDLCRQQRDKVHVVIAVYDRLKINKNGYKPGSIIELALRSISTYASFGDISTGEKLCGEISC